MIPHQSKLQWLIKGGYDTSCKMVLLRISVMAVAYSSPQQTITSANFHFSGSQLVLHSCYLDSPRDLFFCFVLHVKYFVNINNGGYSRHSPTVFYLHVYFTGKFSFHNNMHRPPHGLWFWELFFNIWFIFPMDKINQ